MTVELVPLNRECKTQFHVPNRVWAPIADYCIEFPSPDWRKLLAPKRWLSRQ
jgi:hypothetical protein